MKRDSNTSNANIVIEGALRDHAAAFNIVDIPPGSMSIMLNAALSKVKALGPGALAKVSAGSSMVTDAVRTGFSAVYGGMSEAQKKAELDRRYANAATAGAGLKLPEFGGRYMGNMALAMRDDGERGGKGDRTSSAVYKANLTADGSAISFAKQMGIDPAYAGFFSGASTEMRDALRGAIRNGSNITDDHVKNPNDVAAVIGAIRAGKMKPDDPRIPPSVKQIMEGMKKKGIDPTTAKPDEIKKYFKDNPKALEAAKTAAKADEKATVAGLSAEQAKEKGVKAADVAVAAAQKKDSKPSAKKRPATVSSDLM